MEGNWLGCIIRGNCILLPKNLFGGAAHGREDDEISMENLSDKMKKPGQFSWKDIGDIRVGREHLGQEMPVLIYRLMQYSLFNILSRDCGEGKADEYFQQAGFLAGVEFAKSVLDLKTDFNTFLEKLRSTLLEYKIGILRMEQLNMDTGELVLTVGEDLDCSGLPVTGKTVCRYDEGFLAGILETYTGKKYDVKEIDCWASGDRVCRFRGTIRQ